MGWLVDCKPICFTVSLIKRKLNLYFCIPFKNILQISFFDLVSYKIYLCNMFSLENTIFIPFYLLQHLLFT